MAGESANFGFLRSHDVQLVRLGSLAERYFQEDPSTCLMKLRQFAELLAQLTAAKTGLFVSTDEAQVDLLRRLRAERIIPEEVADLFYQKLRQQLMELCDLHTILRLPTGIFYAQGVKTNVLFFRRGMTERGNTQAVWVYDLRANMNSFGKTRLLTGADFAEFERAFGADPEGTAPRVDGGEEGRFRCFSRAQIADRHDNLDISWLRDTSQDPEDELTEPEEIAGAIATHLGNALREIEALMGELGSSDKL